MSRNLILSLVAASVILVATGVDAQIEKRWKPAPQVGPDQYVVYDTWWTSWGCRDDSDHPMGTGCYHSLDAAIAAANAHMARTSGNGAGAVTKYLIEGEPSVRSRKGPTTPAFGDLVFRMLENTPDVATAVKNVADASTTSTDPAHLLEVGLAKNQEPGSGGPGGPLAEYSKNIEEAYARVKALKDGMLSGVTKATDEEFQKINALVDKFNKNLDNPLGGVDALALKSFPRLTPIDNKTVNAGDAWREAITLDIDLRTEKQKLDDEQARLARERQEWIDESKAVDQLAKEVDSLREQDADYLVGSSVSGWLSVADNALHLRFERNGVVSGFSDADRRTFTGTYHLDGDHITMAMGPSTFDGTISGNQMSGSRQRVGGLSDNWSFTFEGQRPDRNRITSELQAKQQELTRRKSQLNTRLEKYRRDKAQYDSTVAEYEKKHTKKKTMAERLKEFAFEQGSIRGENNPRPRTHSTGAAQ